MSIHLPGLMALFGSGETSPFGGRLFELLAKENNDPLRIAILETPAGFELNSLLVAERVAAFLRNRLQNYHPQIAVVPARKRGTPYSPDDPRLADELHDADMIFLGPGSPTYAARQLAGSLVWQMALARHRLGAQMALASAATIAVSAWALPVYEIYKVGEDPHWKPGLDLFSAFGLPLVVVPHWNNSEGGADLDTSHCFIGRERFEALEAQLSAGMTVLGIDENTGLLVDLMAGEAQVVGRDAVHVRRGGQESSYHKDQRFSLRELGDFRLPREDEGISPEVWAAAHDRTHAWLAQRDAPASAAPDEVQRLVSARQAARDNRAWAEADRLRAEISTLGWRVTDSPDGPQLEKM